MSRPFDAVLRRPFVFVDCGARGTTRHPLVQAFKNHQYIGFEPDAAEAARLQTSARAGYRYFPVAAGARDELRDLHVTQHPGCSSLLTPNAELLARYHRLARFFEVTGHARVPVVPLERYLPAQGITRVHALELDAQGAELEILDGARGLLDDLLLVQTEVEFAPMYVGQPLFGDVDARLRQHGFELFDLARYRVRRSGWPVEAPTRGQLLWGQATYLKSIDSAGDAYAQATLGAIAWILGFSDYAAAALDAALARGAELASEDRDQLAFTRRRLPRTKRPRLVDSLARIEKSPAGGVVRRLARAAGDFREAFLSATQRRNYVWKD